MEEASFQCPANHLRCCDNKPVESVLVSMSFLHVGMGTRFKLITGPPSPHKVAGAVERAAAVTHCGERPALPRCNACQLWFNQSIPQPRQSGLQQMELPLHGWSLSASLRLTVPGLSSDVDGRAPGPCRPPASYPEPGPAAMLTHPSPLKAGPASHSFSISISSTRSHSNLV